jgi:toxin YoeB
MDIRFTRKGFESYVYWADQDPKIFARITALIQMTARSPFAGIGKPEPLKNEYKGWWSRRIDGEHRLIYRVTGSGDQQVLEIIACRFHYNER